MGITRARKRLYLTSARTRRTFGRQPEATMPSRFLHEIPAMHIHHQGSAVGASAMGGSQRYGLPGTGFGQSGSESRPDPVRPGTAVEVAVGDDVVHASFGEGVVIGAEPGGLIVVRFSADGSERKLMSEYAPIQKR